MMTQNKRFVADTNILVSAALIRHSLPWQAINQMEQMGKILYSEATLSELKTVLHRKKFDKYLNDLSNN
jgi:predicted nucleic acid-binding protein